MVPATPVLPGDMLRPVDIVNKFSPRSLAGLRGWDYDPSVGDVVFTPDVGATNSVQFSTDGGYVFASASPDVLPSNSTWSVPSSVSTTPAGRIDTTARDVATLNLVNSLARMGFSLAQIGAMQPGTVIQTGPGGTSTILRQSGAGQTPVPVTLFGGGVSAAANSGAGLGIAVAAVVGALILFSRR